MKVTGSLRLKRGIWQMVFDYQDAAGQRRQKSESTKLPEKGNKRKAQKMLEDRLQELEKQYETALEAEEIPFLNFMRTWLDDVMTFKVKANTLSQYNMIFNGYIAKYKPLHGVMLNKVTPALLQSYYNEQLKAGLSPNTVRKHHANIHKCLSYAVRLGLLAFNPSEQTELPPKRKYKGAVAYTPSQLKELLEVFKGDLLEVPVRIAVTYGLRRSEVCGLRWDAVDFVNGTISVQHTAVVDNGAVMYCDSTKTATSNRVLPLTNSMRSYLKEVQSKQTEEKRLFGNSYVDSGYVCVRPDGEPINPDFVTHHFQRKLRGTELPMIRFHDLRHSAVYALRKGGCDAKDIQSWLGHSDVSTTLNVYGHLLHGDLSHLGQIMDSMVG